MTVLTLVMFGLILGSFVNALVYRVHEQEKPPKKRLKKELSIIEGRSMCPNCHHELSWKDLVPVLSWLTLRGRCRYCHKQISWQYPLVELLTAVLFVVSYLYWPLDWDALGIANFIVWLIMLTGFMALIVYDIRWMLLPNRIVYPLIILAAVTAVVNIALNGDWGSVGSLFLSILIGGGLFYAIFVVSQGRWIGGGDVKLGFLLGILLADPYKAFMTLLFASLLGTLFILPGLLLKKITTKSRIPFGPFLIFAGIFVFLFGGVIIDWYRDFMLLGV